MAVDNRGPPLQVVCYVFSVVAIIAALMRTYVRVVLVKAFGVDDYAMIAALIFFIGFAVSALVGVHFGAGLKMDDIQPQTNIPRAIQCWWFCYLWYCLCTTAAKVSISYFLLRVVARRLHSWIVYFVLGLNLVSGVAFFCITMFQCTPVSKFWNRILPGKCLGMEAVITISYVYGVCGIICDFTCTILPMFVIWELNMDKKTKWALLPVLLLACVASLATVVRFAYLKDAKNAEFLYATINIVLWSCIEQGLAVTAGCLATLRPLLRLWLQKIGTTFTSGSHPRGSSTAGHPLQDRIRSTRGHDRIDDRNVPADGFQRSDQRIMAAGSVESAKSGNANAWDNESEEELTGGRVKAKR